MIREHIPSIRSDGIDGYWTPRRRLSTNKEVADEKKTRYGSVRSRITTRPWYQENNLATYRTDREFSKVTRA
jgi:hypothetical protein